jgi:hypothetical protein
MGLVEINEKYGYTDKCRHQKAQLERIKGLLNKSKIETLSVSRNYIDEFRMLAP